MWRPGAGSGIASFGNEGREYAPLKRSRPGGSGRAKRSRGDECCEWVHEELGGMEAPEALEVARIPSVSVVPVCAVKGVGETPCVKETPCVDEAPCVSGVFTSVPEYVLPSMPCVKGAPQEEEPACAAETARVCEQPCGSKARCVSETPRVSAPAGVSGVVCVSEARCVSERPNVRVTACVRLLYAREMSVGMREHAAASPGVSVMSWCMSIVIHGSLSERMRRRRRLRHLRDKDRVAAVVSLGTVPGLHGSERVVRAVQRTRPPRARLRE